MDFRNENRNPFGFNQGSYGQRPVSPFSRLGSFFKGGSLLSRLILINAGVFVLASLVRLFFFLYQASPFADETHGISYISYWLAVPSDLHQLLQKPWTLITYMFLQENLWHIFFNMLMLYFGGVLFNQYLGSRKLLATYILGGVSGAVFYIAAYNIFPVFAADSLHSVALGASASVLAIIAGIATYKPDYEVHLLFFGKIRFKYIAIIFVLIDILSIEKSNPGGHIAHLGGAFWGFSYILALKMTRGIRNPFRKISDLFKPKLKKVKYHTNRKPLTDDEFSLMKVQNQKKTDAILDKIKKSGYDSLSREEKEFLFRASHKQ